MGVARLNKLLIVTHKSEEEAVLNKLKDASLVELRPYTQKMETQQTQASVNEEHSSKAKRGLASLEKYKEKKKPGEKAGKLVLKKDQYDKMLSSYNFEQVLQDIRGTEEEINILDSEIKTVRGQIEALSPWCAFKGNLEELGSFPLYRIRLIKLQGKGQEVQACVQRMAKKNISVEKLGSGKSQATLIIAYHQAYKKQAESYLSGLEFEEGDLSSYKGTVTQNIERLSKAVDLRKNRRQRLVHDMQKARQDYEVPLTVYLDYLENNRDIEDAINFGFSTDSVAFYTAWVEQNQTETVYKILDSFPATRVMDIEPEEGEVRPTALKNKPLFKPFEIIVNLYGVARYFVLAAPALVSIFFDVFFGLCLTDAGYGFLLVVLTLIFAYKFKKAKNFLLLFFFGGLFTILAGVMFNGWFGDLPEHLGLGHITRQWAFLGDPIATDAGAMAFFRLALLLGVVQVVFGLLVKFVDNLRDKNWGEAFFNALPWTLIVTSLVIILLSTEIAVSMQLIAAPLFTIHIVQHLIWLIIPASLVIILFSARDVKSWGFRLFLGFLNLTIVNGLTSYLGDVLSYIRLMALGLVTAGIGVAINQIAFDMANTVVGVVIAVAVLIFAHIFNLGINMLGGFVHTLRLQYVEFFQKFYVGGGKPFQVLKNRNKYISIVDE